MKLASFNFPSLFMKRILVVLLVQIIIMPIFAQRNGNFGIFFGGSYYMGDLNDSKHFYKPSMNFGILYRHDFDDRHSVKLNGYYAGLRADGNDFFPAGTYYGNHSFSNNIGELSANYEFNFLPFNKKKHRDNFSPYVSLGIGYSYLFNNVLGYLVVPFGGGFRYNITRRMDIGCLWESRMLFQDDLDNLSNGANVYTEISTNPSLFNHDWYNFFGVYLTYKIFKYYEDCDTYNDME